MFYFCFVRTFFVEVLFLLKIEMRLIMKCKPKESFCPPWCPKIISNCHYECEHDTSLFIDEDQVNLKQAFIIKKKIRKK